jgi:ribosomal protein L29
MSDGLDAARERNRRITELEAQLEQTREPEQIRKLAAELLTVLTEREEAIHLMRKGEQI